MSMFREVSAAELELRPFARIGQDWMLIGAAHDGCVNAMTASWGGVGVIWGQNVAYIFVRRSRFTKEFIDAEGTFSLTFFDPAVHREMLSYMGRVSGRDADKIATAGLTVCHDGETPYFAEANLVLLCRKLSRVPLTPDCFIDAGIDGRWYKDHDYHDMYVGAVTKILVRE